MLRIGLAGLGHGKTLLQANTIDQQELPMKVTAICDTDPSVLGATSEEYGIEQTTTDFNELVKLRDLDVIGIYTPGPLHAEQILTALSAGKHVMVTKSMVYTISEAEQVVAAVDQTGLKLLVTQSMRGRFDFIEAKRAHEAGELGELFMAESHYLHDLRPVYKRSPWRVQMPQDLILGGACHPIDLLRWFMGDIDEVHCYGLRSGISEEYPKEDNFVINVKFVNGTIGRIANFLGIIEPPDVPMNELALYGTKGTLINGKKRVDSEGIYPSRSYSSSYPDATRTGHAQEMVVMMQHMADCVLNGTEPWVSARDGARVVSTCIACWDSCRTGLPSKVRNEF